MKKKILVIDDEKSIRFIIENTFNKEFEVTTLNNGMDALVYLQAGNLPDVIMKLLLLFSYIVQSLLLCYLAFGTFYIFLFSVAGLFRLKNHQAGSRKKRRIAVFIPGYKEDAVIVEAAEEACKQNYPRELFDVIVIADTFQPSTIGKLKALPVRIIEVSFKESTKSKALNAAMASLPDDRYDIALVLDADNVMENDFLIKIISGFSNGYAAVQGHRVAKNMNTSFAVLDAVSEEINNHIFRKGHRVLGFSSSLIGSGMAFDYLYFKTLMKDIQAIGGFDKEIELTMLREGKKIEYLEKAFIYDEKVQASGVFIKQRRRWLSAQIHYSRYFLEALGHLFRKGNADFFDKALQMLLPPRILSLGALFLFSLLSILINPLFLTLIWLVLLMVCILAILFAIPGDLYTRKLLTALLNLPRGFILMFYSLFSTKGANKRFIHTEHTQTSEPSSINQK